MNRDYLEIELGSFPLNARNRSVKIKDTLVILKKKKFKNRNFSDKDIMAIFKFCPNQNVTSKSTIVISEFRSASVLLN